MKLLDNPVTHNFLKFLVQKLNISDASVKIFEQSDGDKYIGCVYECGDSEFHVILNTDRISESESLEYFYVIAHEYVHIKQYLYDNLGYLLKGCKIPYEYRWWEHEARELGEKYLEEFCKLLEKTT